MASWFNLTANGATAIGTVVIAFFTAALALIAWFQIGTTRRMTKEWKTLDVCGEYERNSVIEGAARRISNRLRYLKNNPSNPLPDDEIKITDNFYYRDAIVILNYLDSVAIGIEQNLYDERLAKAHLEPIVKAHVSHFLKGVDYLGIDRRDFDRVCSLCERWEKSQPTPVPWRFHKGALLTKREVEYCKDAGLDEIAIVLPLLVAIAAFWPLSQLKVIFEYCTDYREIPFRYFASCHYMGKGEVNIAEIQSILAAKWLACVYVSLIFLAFWKFESVKNSLGFWVSIAVIAISGLIASQGVATVYLGSDAPNYDFHAIVFLSALAVAAVFSMTGFWVIGQNETINKRADKTVLVVKAIVYGFGFWIVFQIIK